MQIDQIVIYSRDRRSKPIEFAVGRLNVITGVKRRGKSALLEIVDWCLGRRDFTVPEGRVRDACAWYGVLLIHGGSRTWVARPEPPTGVETPSGMMLVPAAPETPPESDELFVNSDRRAVREHLSAVLGIEEGTIPRAEGRLKPALRLSSAQAVPLCLQNQDEIASKTLLFHRQYDTQLADDLQAALPYFLGAVDPETPMVRAELVRARRALLRANHRLEVSRVAAKTADARAAELVKEAQSSGLEIGDELAPMAQLRHALAAGTEPRADALTDSRAATLIGERRALLARRRDVERQIALLLTLQGDVEAFGEEAAVEVGRLRSLDLLPRADGLENTASCPACAQPLSRSDPSHEALQAAAENLQAELAESRRVPVRTASAVRELESELDQVDLRLRDVAGALKSLQDEGDRIAREGSLAQARAYVQGRISEYVRLAEASSSGDLESEVQAVHAAEVRVGELEAQLDPDLEEDEVEVRLNQLSEAMTDYGRQLQLEHVDPPASLRLHLDRMTAYARTPTGSKWLPTIGSGSNWVGFHLAAHLGLHEFFARHERPVPRFLMLDQPTQAFYPEDVPAGQTLPAEDLDREDVRRLFRVLWGAASKLQGRLQIIVCDHAKLTEEPWFMDSIAADWRGENGLVPHDWPDRPGGASE